MSTSQTQTKAKEEIKKTLFSCTKYVTLLGLLIAAINFVISSIEAANIRELIFNLLTIGASPEKSLVAVVLTGAIFAILFCSMFKILDKFDKESDVNEIALYKKYLSKHITAVILFFAISVSLLIARCVMMSDIQNKAEAARIEKLQSEAAQKELEFKNKLEQSSSFKLISTKEAYFEQSPGACETWEVKIEEKTFYYMLSVAKSGMKYVTEWEFNNNFEKDCFNGYAKRVNYNNRSDMLKHEFIEAKIFKISPQTSQK